MRKLILVLFATLVISPSVNIVSSASVSVLPAAAPVSSEPSPDQVKAALAEFKSLSRKEKKKRLKMLNAQLKTMAALKEKGYETDTNTLLLVLIAILLPPLAVYLHQGEINSKFWITLILWLLGWAVFTFLAWFPLLVATIYALIVILGNQ